MTITNDHSSSGVELFRFPYESVLPLCMETTGFLQSKLFDLVTRQHQNLV